jgi:hypothetical protein
MELGTELPHQ